MTSINYRAAEALYTIILRDKDAERLLKDWARDTKAQVRIENNRMHIFEHQTLISFQMKWSHPWTNVTIWDCWNRRHLT